MTENYTFHPFFIVYVIVYRILLMLLCTPMDDLQLLDSNPTVDIRVSVVYYIVHYIVWRNVYDIVYGTVHNNKWFTVVGFKSNCWYKDACRIVIYKCLK